MSDDDIPLIEPEKVESYFTIGFWDGTPYDVNGVRVVELCDCGKEATTCIQGVNTCLWKCHECMFGKSQAAELVYKPSPLPITPDFLNDAFVLKMKHFDECFTGEEWPPIIKK